MSFDRADRVREAAISYQIPFRLVDATSSSDTALRTFADFFSGIGGFHIGASQLGLKCAFACDIDETARRIYAGNFGIVPFGDITELDDPGSQVPDHDVLFAGLPCQPFSIIGGRRGMADPRGTLFFDTARVIEAKKPRAVVIENVKQFTSNQGGKAMACVLSTLESFGYGIDWRVLNALNFGLPQRRERVYIVAVRGMSSHSFPWPSEGAPMLPLEHLLEADPPSSSYASERIREARQRVHTARFSPAIWHENKGGNISSHPFSCALRASASYNYLLVDGERRLTARELLRLQGFPDSYSMEVPITTARRLTGNAVAVPVVAAVVKALMDVCKER